MSQAIQKCRNYKRAATPIRPSSSSSLYRPGSRNPITHQDWYKYKTEPSGENPAMIFRYTHFMMAKVTAEDVANGVDLAVDELSKPCDSNIIPSLADCFLEWEVIFGSLLSEIDVNYVKEDNTTGVNKRMAALRKWRDKNGREATYKVLVDALLNRGERDQAENLCKILAKHSMSNKNGQTSETTTTDCEAKESESDIQFQCPCRKCSLETYLEDGCPQSYIPYLGMTTLSKADKEDLNYILEKDTEKIMDSFANLSNATCDSIKQQGVTVDNLVRVAISSNSSLHDQLIRSTSVDQVFAHLFPEMSFFNHESLAKIIDRLGDQNDKDRLADYSKEFKGFCKRKVFEVEPGNCTCGQRLSQLKGRKLFAVVLPTGEKVLQSLGDAVRIKKKLADVLGVSPASLHLHRIDQGCVILVFSVPDSIAEEIFTLSKEKLDLLRVQGMVIFVPQDSKSQVEDTLKPLACSTDVHESSKESYFEPNTGVQSDYCQQHIQMLSQQQDGYNPFTTPRTPQWSIDGNTDSSGVASDSSDDQDMSSQVQSDDGSLRPTPAVPSSSSSSNWGWASAFSSLLTQRTSSKKIKQQHVPPSKSGMQPATPATALARPATVLAPQRQAQQQQSTISAVPQATFTQAPQQSISVPQAVPGPDPQSVCRLPGCNRPRFMDPGGKVHACCGENHALQYEQQNESKMAATTNVDSQGKQRGRCSSCACDGYDGGSEKKRCVACGHPPGKHQNLSTSSSVSGSSSGVSSISALSPPSTSMGFCDGSDSAGFTPSSMYQCRYPGCQKESDFEPNTGVQSDYCHKHIQYIQMLSQQQDGYNPFTTPRIPQWSIGGNTDSSGVASDFSDDQDMSSQVQSDDGNLRPTSAVPSSSSSSNWGWASAFSSLLTQRTSSKKTKQQHVPPSKSGMQPATPATAQAKLATAPAPQQQAHQQQSMIPAMPQATFSQVPQQLITVPQAVPGQPVCKLPGCNRPRFVEPGGKMHDYCGRRHARQYEQQYALQIPQHLQCATPGCKKQKHPNPNGGYFDYCSLYCQENGLTSASTPLQIAGFGICSLPGCNRFKYRDPANGRILDFCGRAHASQARAQGLQPSNPSMIRQANQQEFSQVSQQFTRDWDPRKGVCPKVDFVYVVSNPALEARWSAYKQNLQNQNVEEYYHGTRLICDLSNMPCTNADCGVCGISNTGLDRRCIRKNINFQRFGHGFYLAPNSSKCHDYTQGAHGYRVMLRCAVCPGRKYTLRTDQVNPKGPPAGYDCVYGQEGSSLNYAEIVVYNPDAVVPRYIIVYQKDGTHKIAK